MTWKLVAIEAAAAVFLAAVARAETLHLAARLVVAADAAPADTSPDGNLWADFDTHDHVLTYRLTYRRLSGPAIAARLQGPARQGQGAPTILALPGSSSPITGKATLTAAEAADLERGRWCVDVATTANPEGEIRGQVKSQADADAAELLRHVQVSSPSAPPPPALPPPWAPRASSQLSP